MKKIFLLIVSLFIFVSSSCFADDDDNNVLNVHTNNNYILFLDNRPINLQNSNTRILKVDLVTNILDNSSSLLFSTIGEGIAYITFKLDNQTKTLKILIDNNAEEDKNLVKLDKVDSAVKK